MRYLKNTYIQRFTLFLGHPLYAVAVVLAGFLVFSGIGSAVSGRLDRALAPTRFGALQIAVAGITLFALLCLIVLPPAFAALIALPVLAKIVVSLAFTAPLACFMGMPFPLGIARVAARDGDLVPWAWGLNGCASVVAAVLATLIAIHAGFTVIVLIASALYLPTPFLLHRTPK